MWSETVSLRTRPVCDHKIGLGLGIGYCTTLHYGLQNFIVLSWHFVLHNIVINFVVSIAIIAL